VTALDGQRELCDFCDLGRQEAGVLSFVGGNLGRFDAPRTRDDLNLFVADDLRDQREVTPVHEVGIRRRVSGDDRLSEPVVGVDDDPVVAAHRVERETHTRGVRSQERLHDDCHSVFGRALFASISNGALAEHGAPALLDGVVELGCAHPEHGFVLPGEARALGVLGDTR